MTAPLDPKNDWVAKNPSDPESEWRYTHTEQNLVADNVRWLKANGGGGGGTTNLTTTRTPTAVTVVSSSGTDAALPAADNASAGVMTAADRIKINSLGPLATLTPSGTANASTFLNGAGAYSVPSGGTGGGATNLTMTRTVSDVTVLSDTGTDVVIPAADGVAAGLMTTADRSKFGGISPGATANSTDTFLRDRANHTGLQLAATISDLDEKIQDVVALMIVDAAGVPFVYDDVTGKLTINTGGGTLDITAIDGGVLVAAGGATLDGGTAASAGAGTEDGGTPASPGAGTIDGGTP